MEEQSTPSPSQALEHATMSGSSGVTPPDQLGYDWRKWCVGLGGLMMLLILLLSVLNPAPQSGMFYFASRGFFALGGGLLAGGVIGFIEIESTIYRNSLRGGGGFAVFLVLYLINPPTIPALLMAPSDRQAALNQIDALASAPVYHVQGETIGEPLSLSDVVMQHGFMSITHFKVTATDAQVEQVRQALASHSR